MKRALLVLLVATALNARAEKPLTPEDRAHWAFVRPSRPAEDRRSAANSHESSPLDRFLLDRLETAGLTFSPEADRRTLIRRLTFDLTGLPPSPEEVDAFLQDQSPDAWDKLTDRLLASPAYGERQAQHWLDVARFAESDGFELDAVRPDAWRYRDWVIAAFNADMPYDRFLQLQLAGDEIAPDDESARIATGFLMAGPDMPDINLPEERRHQFLNGMTATVGEAVMGLTLGCAQCHDHKTDPVSIDDFYRLRAVFANTVTAPRRDEPLGGVVREPGSAVSPDFVMIRGDFRRPGDEAAPGFPRVLNPDNTRIDPPADAAKSSLRRTALARWLTRPEHPLTARVMVNRLWQQHFGRGLVASPGDFGRTGSAPSHPELLDWLATELPARDWSLKALHKLIVTSRAYRQASRGEGPAWTAALASDPSAELLSRMPRRRLEGEAVRDSFLAVSGLLNRQSGGPGVRPPLPPEVTDTLLKKQWEVTRDAAAHHRRSIHVFARRNLRFPLFEVFDRPDSNQVCSRRDRSTTATQSLTLLNSPFALEAATALAARVSAETPGTDSRITRMYALLFARPPHPLELTAGRRFLGENPASARLAHYGLALLNTNEAIHID